MQSNSEYCTKKSKMSFEDDVIVNHFDKRDELKYMVKINAPAPTDHSEMTTLHVAAKLNQIELLTVLLDLGYDANVKTSSGMTPLLLAVHCNQFDAVVHLLERGADVFVTDWANRSVLEILLSKSPVLPLNLMARVLNILIQCPFDVATKAEILVRAQCNLKLVLYLKDARATEEFLKRKSFINDVESTVALEFAMSRLDLKNVRVLLQFGFGVSVRREIFFRKLFDCSIAGKCRNLQLAKVFYERLDAWNLIVEDTLDDFYLMFSIGDTDLVELLLQCNVDVCFSLKLGRDLVAHMFENRIVNAIELLEKRKFNVNGKGDGGSTALHFAIRGNSEKNVRFLLDSGADIEIKNERGRTPLLEAVAYNRIDIMIVLLHYGADIRAVIHEKFTVFDPFEKSFCPTMQEYLIAQLTVNRAMGVPIENSILERINLNRRCKKSYEQCSLQIKEMQRIKITKSFTLFTAVAKEIQEIARYVRDEQTAEIVKSYCRQRNIHSYYYSILMHKLEKAISLSECNFY